MALGRFQHRLGAGLAVFLEQVALQRSGIDSDAHRAAVILRRPYDLADPLLLADISGIDAQAGGRRTAPPRSPVCSGSGYRPRWALRRHARSASAPPSTPRPGKTPGRYPRRPHRARGFAPASPSRPSSACWSSTGRRSARRRRPARRRHGSCGSCAGRYRDRAGRSSAGTALIRTKGTVQRNGAQAAVHCTIPATT